jgi:hypothetical protein
MEKLNMWGKPGCELPDGGTCHCCCALSIDTQATCGPVSIDHDLYQRCPTLKVGEGCGDYERRPASPCRDFDCRRATEAQLSTLFGIARIVFGIHQTHGGQAKLSRYWRASQ